MKAIINGEIVDGELAKVNIIDRGLLLSDGLFETMDINHKRINFFDLHWKRMTDSLEKLYITPPFSKEQLLEKIYALIDLQDNLQGHWSVRITVTRGEGNRGIVFSPELKPNYFITMSPWLAPKQNLHMVIASSRRNEYSTITQIKTLNYLDNVLARHEAILSGADDAIFLNSKGLLTESTVANIFVVINDTICTPPVSDGLIPGVMREAILRNAAQQNIAIKECSVALDELKNASEVFLTNVLVGIQRVDTIENYFSASDSRYFNLMARMYQALLEFCG